MTDNKEGAAQAAPVAIDPEAFYEVQLTRAVEFLGVWHSPMDTTVFRGRFIAELGDAVGTVTPV